VYAVLSPAKSLSLDPVEPLIAPSQPALLDDARKLATTGRNTSQKALRELMGISADLARLNSDRFKVWTPEHHPGNSWPAAYLFAGDTYRGLQARTFDADALLWAQDHLGILSGLYGLLRPMDLVQPYRLEMGTALKTRRGANLYAFWRDTIRKAIQERLEGHADPTLVCLASVEYFTAVQPRKFRGPIVTCEFRELRDGEARMISFFAKQARGAMARWMVDNRAETAQDLKDFDYEGYAFAPELSDGSTFTFLRESTAAP
jgi:cytoplasmic iron level regulating protein YaaA (DUF328/UPF0246 family)